jgi:hypothetical protein
MSGRVPGYIYEAWKQCKEEGLRFTIGQILGMGMHFAVYGPHPYDNPVDGLEDALKFYENRQDRLDIIKEVIESIADKYGIAVKFED